MECIRCAEEIDDAFLFCPWCGQNQTRKVKTRKTSKRENGTGSVYKRGDRKNRPWVAVAPTMREDKAPSKRMVIGYFDTIQEARKALEAFIDNPTPKYNLTLNNVYNEWSKSAYPLLSKQLVGNYTAAWKKLSPLYGMKFREIRTVHIQKIIDAWSREQDGHAALSNSSLSKIKVLMTSLYKHAMQNDIVMKDYAQFVRLPKAQKEVKPCFTEADLKVIENGAQTGIPFADCVLMMCYTGFRIAEFLSLTKDSIHYYNDIAYIQGGSKTEAGKNRRVPIHEKVRPYFDAWLDKEGETIICRDNGTPFPVKYFREKCFYPVLEELRLPKLTPHATRRTFATRLSAAGVREEEIIKLMGHTDFGVDIDSYINPEVGTLLDAVNRLK